MNNQNAFTSHNQVVPLREVLPPQRVITVPVRMETDRAKIDALADYWLSVERAREAQTNSK